MKEKGRIEDEAAQRGSNTDLCILKMFANIWSVQPTVPLEDKRTTQRVPHAEPTRWRFELNALAFACPRKRKRV